MGIWKTFFNNTRKPEGLLGRCMVDSMNHAHAALADWGLSRLPETGPSQIAELPGLRSWAVAVVGTFGRFCENIRLQLLLLWIIQKYP